MQMVVEKYWSERQEMDQGQSICLTCLTYVRFVIWDCKVINNKELERKDNKMITGKKGGKIFINKLFDNYLFCN